MGLMTQKSHFPWQKSFQNCCNITRVSENTQKVLSPARLTVDLNSTMKPGSLLPLVALALIPTACATSQDESFPESSEQTKCGSEKIEFNLSFSNKSAFSDLGTLPTRFAVSAVISNPEPTADHQVYFEHDVMEDIGANGQHRWVDRTANRAWPSDPDTALDFFFYGGVANGPGSRDEAKDIADTEIIWDAEGDTYSPALKIWIDEEYGRQYDLVAGAAFNQKKSTVESRGGIPVNLCHPMTQVLFDTRLINENLHVEIFDIEICGTAKGAYFEFPTAPGKEPHWHIPQHSDNHVDAHISVATSDRHGFAVTPELTGISYEGDPCCPEPTAGKSLWLIPGAYSRGRYMGGMWAGVYIKVRCLVWNVAQAGRFDRDSDYLLFGGKDADGGLSPEWMYIPVNWGEADTDPSRDLGATYIYTLKFGAGNSAKSADGLNLNNIASWELRMEQ